MTRRYQGPVAFLLFCIVASAGKTCYRPNKVPEPDHVPCNQSADYSHCYVNWRSSSCFQECKGAKNPIPITPTGGFVSVDAGVRLFCCDVNTFDKDSGNYRRTGSIEVFNSTHTNATTPVIVSNASIAPTQTVTVTAPVSSEAESLATAKETAIGVGVGAPLALALVGVSFLLWREKRKRRETEERNLEIQRLVKRELVRTQKSGPYTHAYGDMRTRTSPIDGWPLESGGAGIEELSTTGGRSELGVVLTRGGVELE
ncbi:uncharacterized protein BDR25DRAFT_345385 [Lindgomyces ingoldianus]|uniref:Uncharacterized protein n=1 Tax=Lindgomyces ingoldianus TaxID=673940 RepID=A0ACB6QIT1_9PLEO|nr:uncharacterized protein BDR25DRAFT_345385 [Lindgomyces ingoldianus]KAF2466800.1 hypothetical protein BDR25DRAFT_345385 [Lindgomyces ingoldianus]